MFHKDLLICKARMLLDEFLAPVLAQVDKPRQQFPKQTVRAILFFGSLVAMELCKWIRNKCSDPYLSRQTTIEQSGQPVCPSWPGGERDYCPKISPP